MTFRAWRRSLGLDMAGAAQMLGVSLRFVYLWERAVANDNRPMRKLPLSQRPTASPAPKP